MLTLYCYLGKGARMEKMIWVVEDDQGIRDMVCLLLRTEGYEVKSFENAQQFRQALKSGEKLDLLLTDVMLPDGNGLYLCQLVKTASSEKSIPVLVMSARLNFYEQERFCRADDFIAKPFDISDMVKRINKLIA